MIRKALRRVTVAPLAGSLMAAALAVPAAAQYEPVIVVPGRAGVPVMMYGVDISGAVIEGEFGLARPGTIAPTIIMPYWSRDVPVGPGGYFPSTGHRPRAGRLEVIPPANRPMPTPAEPFYREWESHSAPGPATAPVPYDPPPVIVAPQFGGARPSNPHPVAPPPHPALPPPVPPKKP